MRWKPIILALGLLLAISSTGVALRDAPAPWLRKLCAVAPPTGSIECGGVTWFSDGTTGRSWTDADAYCRSLGGNLASIHNAAEQACAETVLIASGAPDDGSWMGFREVQIEGHFQWSDGTPTDFLYWLEGEPSNDSGSLNDCAHFWQDREFRWNDILCTRKDQSFLCRF